MLTPVYDGPIKRTEAFSMNVDRFAYVLGAALLGAMAAVLACALSRGKRGWKKFDERQIAARGKAAELAFYTDLVYAALCIILCAENDRIGVPTAMFGGVILSAGVYAVACILGDAYFNLSEKPERTIFSLALLTALEFLNAGLAIAKSGLIVNGTLNFKAAVLLSVGVMLAIVLLTAAVKLFFDRRREKRENTEEGGEA